MPLIKLELIYRFVDNEFGYNHFETISINRMEQEVIIEKRVANVIASRREYYVADGVAELLEDIEEICDKVEPGMVEPPENEPTPTYVVNATYDDGTNKQICGVFNKADMPENWKHIVECIKTFLNEENHLALLSDSVCGLEKLASDEIRLASVFFGDDDSQLYHYNDTIGVEPGDYVIVPTGRKNKKTSAMVYSVSIYKKDETPIPLEKIKSIIRIDD